MGYMGFGGVELLVVVLMQLAFLALVVLGIVWLVRKLSANGSSGGGGRTRSALEEIEMRYARGEIDRSTYQQMKDDLTRDGSG